MVPERFELQLCGPKVFQFGFLSYSRRPLPGGLRGFRRRRLRPASRLLFPTSVTVEFLCHFDVQQHHLCTYVARNVNTLLLSVCAAPPAPPRCLRSAGPFRLAAELILCYFTYIDLNRADGGVSPRENKL